MPNFDLATITSLTPQKTVTSPTPVQHQYEVTESNDISQKEYQTVLPTFLPPEFATLSTLVNPDLQTNDVYLNNHPASNIGLIGTNIQLGQPNLPMQTNLHSSLHVGFPGTAAQTPYIINQQIPDLHVGHPAPAGPPLSATQLYDLLNSFPQKMPEQYQTGIILIHDISFLALLLQSKVQHILFLFFFYQLNVQINVSCVVNTNLALP